MTSNTTTATESPLVAKVRQRFADVGFGTGFGPEESRLTVRLYRRLARDAQPVSPSEVVALAAEVGMERDEAERMMQCCAERDEAGNVRGIIGLSLNDHPHKFRVNGKELATWCALDPMFIAPAVGRDVVVATVDPSNGSSIRVQIPLDGAVSGEPDTAVLSVVIPAGQAESVEAIWMQFCNHVHFFRDRESGEAYFSDKEMEVYFLSLGEAFELGRALFGGLLQHA